MTERKISGKTIFKGHVFTVEVDMADCGGRVAEREIVRHPGGVAILAVDGQNRVIMVRQYRYAAGKELLELPAGRLEPGEDPIGAGRRELSEETGYTAEKIELFGRLIPTGGYCSEVIHVCLATGLTEGQPHPDEGKYVTAEPVPMDDALRMVLSGEIEDGKTAYAIMKYALGHI